MTRVRSCKNITHRKICTEKVETENPEAVMLTHKSAHTHTHTHAHRGETQK